MRRAAPGNDTPDPERGSVLDAKLGQLIVSVSTALDQYRSLANVGSAELLEGAESIDGSHLAGRATAIADSQLLSGATAVAMKKAREIVPENETEGDALVRTLQDAKTINDLARSELRLHKVVLRWFSELARTLKDYPTIIRRAGVAVQAAAEIGGLFAKRWSDFQRDALTSLMKQVKDTGKTLMNVADVLDNHSAQQRALTDAAARKATRPDVFEDFDNWLHTLILARDKSGKGVSVGLVAEEAHHESGKTLREMAMLKKFKNEHEFIEAGSGFIIREINGVDRVFRVDAQKMQSARRRGMQEIVRYCISGPVYLGDVLNFIREYNDSNHHCLLARGEYPGTFFANNFKYFANDHYYVSNVVIKRPKKKKRGVH